MKMKSKKYYTPDELNYMDAGMFTFGPSELRIFVAEALSKVPINIADRVREKCLFVTITEEEKGSYWPKEFFKNKSLIFIAQGVLDLEMRNEAIETILHEVAHYYLKHKHPFDFEGLTHTEEYNRQEAEANEQVAKWLREHEAADPITKLSDYEWSRLKFRGKL